jgi:Ser/Thr protein kinase RdoA (MazF antagonist)
MPQDAVDPVRLRGLHRLLAHIHSCGVTQVAVPLARDDGATFAFHAGCVWQLEPWLPGTAEFRSAPSRRRLENALVCLARWHQAARAFSPLALEQSWFFVSAGGRSPGLSERAGQLAACEATFCDCLRRQIAADYWEEFRVCAARILELFERVAPRVAGELRVGDAVAVPLQPCLRDVWHDHVLFTGDEVTGLIDAHACRSDSVATDLARLLGSLVGDDCAAWPLNPMERGLVELFDHSAVALSGMTWLDWRYRDGRPFERPQAVLERLAAIERRLEVLAEKVR